MEVARESLYGFEFRDVDRRRAPEGERKTYDIKQLWQRNHEILRMALIGMKPKDIAERLDITTQTVSNTLNSELGRQKLSFLRQKRDETVIEISEEVSRLLPKAIKIYEDIMDGSVTSKLMKETADTLVMDIAGHRAPTKVQSESAHLHMTPKDLEELKQRGIAAAKASGMVIDLVEE